jgi:hypothetical protein
LPGSTSQLPWQSAEQLALQSALKEAWHSPWQAATKDTGSHWASHPPETSTVHSALASTWMFPQELRSASLLLLEPQAAGNRTTAGSAHTINSAGRMRFSLVA